MIKFNSHQLNIFSYKNKSHQTSSNFNSQFIEKDIHLNHAKQHTSENTYSQKTANEPFTSLMIEEKKTSGSHYFKQQLSLMAKFAIQQYEVFSDIEKQQTNESMLGINEYA